MLQCIVGGVVAGDQPAASDGNARAEMLPRARVETKYLSLGTQHDCTVPNLIECVEHTFTPRETGIQKGRAFGDSGMSGSGAGWMMLCDSLRRNANRFDASSPYIQG